MRMARDNLLWTSIGMACTAAAASDPLHLAHRHDVIKAEIIWPGDMTSSSAQRASAIHVGSTLDPLEGFPGLRSAGLFTLDHPGITREQPRALEGRPEPRVIQLQGFADAVPEGLGLTRHPTTPDCGLHVVVAVRPRDGEWCQDIPPPLKGGEDMVEAPAVHGDDPGAWFEPDPRNARLPLACQKHVPLSFHCSLQSNGAFEACTVQSPLLSRN